MVRVDNIHILYLNGLGTGKARKREQLAIRYLAKHGIEVTHVPIDWRSGESFTSLLDHATKLAEEQLRKHGKLIIVGVSAGGSLAINILGRLRNKNLSAITLCSRLRQADLPWWDWRTLERMAYIGKPKESKAFFDSVTYCGTTTIPQLTSEEKQRIVIVQQWADDVVPRATMGIDGVRVCKVPAFGHAWGIAAGVWCLPEITARLGYT